MFFRAYLVLPRLITSYFSLRPSQTSPLCLVKAVSSRLLFKELHRAMPKNKGKGQSAAGAKAAGAKAAGATAAGATAAGATAAGATAAGPVSKDQSGAVTISVHAKPGAKLSAVTEVSAAAVCVSVAAPPTDGEANTELLRFLAEVLQLKKTQISLYKGSRSRDKVMKVESGLNIEEVLLRLTRAMT